MLAQYTIGLDYGTNSVRTLIVNVANGKEVATAVWNYEHGTAGVVLSRDPNLARQHPADYIKGAEISIKNALGDATKHVRGFTPGQIIGIGVDTTGSTPLPVDADGQPLAFQKKFSKNPAAMAWLWKDHTSHAEAARVTELADPFAISLNGVSKHIRMLERADLVRRRHAGREHFLSLNPQPLDEAAAWIASQRAAWTARLDTLEALLRAEDEAAAASKRRKRPRSRQQQKKK